MVAMHKLALQLSREGFSVGPPTTWGAVATETMALLKEEGLRPMHHLVDVGSGLFRIGARLIDYLHPGHYWAIEPDTRLVSVGLDRVLTQDQRAKLVNPVMHHTNADLADLPMRPNFVLARSVWSHAPLSWIKAMVGNFSVHGASGAKLVASYYESALWPRHRWHYRGDSWHNPVEGRFGSLRRHGTAYDASVIEGVIEEAGLRVVRHTPPGVNGQRWIVALKPCPHNYEWASREWDECVLCGAPRPGVEE